MDIKPKKNKETGKTVGKDAGQKGDGGRVWWYVAALVVVFVASFSYIFNEKIDLNGDNCRYYMLATSIADGHGFADITNPAYPPTNVFPPGYPLLMSVLMLLTDSIIAQKILNGLFLLASVILLFTAMRRRGIRESLAFVASAAVLLNYQLLHFSTMMMSEMSFLFMSTLAFFALVKMDDEKPFWKDGWFYTAVVAAAFAYHIRTQGIAVLAAVFGYFLFTRRWKELAAYTGGSVICLLPWMIRNKMAGLGGSRYLDSVLMSNHWRPEEGQLGIGDVIGRFFDTLRMLMTQAVPDSILPYITTDYGATPWWAWLSAALIWGAIGVGMWQFGKYKWLVLCYVLATLGVISIFSTPSGNRYITTMLPFLEVSLLVGVYTCLRWVVVRMKVAKDLSPWVMTVLLLCAVPRLQRENKMNSTPFPPNYANFFAIAEAINRELPRETVVCSRKPELYYMYGKTAVTQYKWTDDAAELIRHLVQSKTDYVILEQLGYSSTARYLYPAIQANPDLFPIVMHLKNPDTYLLKFDIEKARTRFGE